MDFPTKCLLALNVDHVTYDLSWRKKTLESKKKYSEEKEAYLLSRKHSLEESRKLLEERRVFYSGKLEAFKAAMQSCLEGEETSKDDQLLFKGVCQCFISFILLIDEKILSLDEIMELEEKKYCLEYKIREKKESIEYLLETYNKSTELSEEK